MTNNTTKLIKTIRKGFEDIKITNVYNLFKFDSKRKTFNNKTEVVLRKRHETGRFEKLFSKNDQ